MRFLKILLVAVFGLAGLSAARATVQVQIDLSTQTMHVTSSTGSYSWPVSTARAGYVTPRGTFSPQWMTKMTYSKLYNNAPMPHAIFFSGGYAIHGTTAVGQLGRPASHGCIRLSPDHAAELYRMVEAEGASISISGSPPVSRFAEAGSVVRHAAHRADRTAALAYAPTHRVTSYGSVRAWQANPSAGFLGLFGN